MADMAEISRPELCIVGAGALGIALAQHARRLGVDVTLVDRGFVEPGDAPQRALRLAALVASAAAAAGIRAAPALGLGPLEPKIGMKAVQDRARQVAMSAAPLDSHERLAALGISVVSGAAHFADPGCLVVGEVHIRAQAFVLAVGNDAIVPAIPGLEDAGYFTLETILDNSRKLTHLLVIGSDPEGLALAQAHARLGSQVTVVPQGPALAGYDVEAASILLQALADEGVRVLDGGSVRAVQPRSQGIGAVVDLPEGGEEMLDLSHILVCSGQVARLADLNPDIARLRSLRGQTGRYAIGALGQTSNRRVRVAGMAAGLDQWQHALSHGRSVVESLVLGVPRHRPAALPRLVLTEPALAQIGRLPADTSKLAPGHGLYRVNLAENALLRAQGRGGGLVKVLADPKGRLIGASVVGPGAADMAGVLALAMDQGVALDGLADLPIPYPSLMSSLVALGENRLAARTVSSWAKRRGALARILRL
jgi:pyruvate/2-oxoglutarate dehydrogenase complex dihydrolipoamide dehydrogenase (E3) component